MRFMYSVGGVDAPVMTTPAHKGIPSGIVGGQQWAADNQAFTQGFDPARFFPWLESMQPFRETCLFVTIPDVVGDAPRTIANWHRWIDEFRSWPVAFVAQDGQEHLPLPDAYDVLFVGGSTEWKLSTAAEDVIMRAQADGKHIHIGRVNWGARYRHFRLMPGSENWTCDGTRQRFEGINKTKQAWRGYEAQLPLWSRRWWD